MTFPIQAGDGTRFRSQFPLVCLNGTAETIPPYGVMQVAGASNFGTDRMFLVTKPTGVAGASYVLNGPQAIAAVGYGAATNSYPADAAYSGTPVAGAEWGPVAGSWSLSINGKGFQILGGAAGGVVRVTTKAGTTAPGDDFPLVRIVNMSGLARPFGSIVGYGSPVDPPPGTLWRIPTFQSAAPAAGKPFCVLLNDIANNDTGDAGPLAVLPVQIDFTDASHKFADCVTGDYAKLKSGTSGPAIILWREKQGIAGADSLGVQWARVLLDRGTEAYRLIRGKAYQPVLTTTKTFEIYALDPLASGLDPRTDPNDATEKIKVANVHKSSYEQDDWVDAAYSVDAHLVAGDTIKADWEALPKGGEGGGTIRFARVYSAISAASGNLAANWGSGLVRFMDDSTGALDASPTVVDNKWIGVSFVADVQVVCDTSKTPPVVIEGTCEAVTWGA